MQMTSMNEAEENMKRDVLEYLHKTHKNLDLTKFDTDAYSHLVFEDNFVECPLENGAECIGFESKYDDVLSKICMFCKYNNPVGFEKGLYSGCSKYDFFFMDYFYDMMNIWKKNYPNVHLVTSASYNWNVIKRDHDTLRLMKDGRDNGQVL